MPTPVVEENDKKSEQHVLRSISSINYVVLLCTDLPAMKQFYSRVMNFPVERDWGDWVEYRVGGTLLTLRPRGRRYDGPAVEGAAGVQLAFQVAPHHVTACFHDLTAADVRILEEVTDKSSGHRTVFFQDPDGNILEIYAELSNATETPSREITLQKHHL